jgi:hypothetical protein
MTLCAPNAKRTLVYRKFADGPNGYFAVDEKAISLKRQGNLAEAQQMYVDAPPQAVLGRGRSRS